MKTYTATYETKSGVINADFEATNLKEAKRYAQMHKSHTPEIKLFGRVKTTVRVNKSK